MSTDLSFNKEKMKVECGKLLRISNLGEKTLLGYIQNLKQSNDFSDLEWRFLKETTNLLIPSSVYVCAEYEDKEAIVEWNKALIKATLGETALPYVMTHTEEIHCHTKEDILTLYRKRYFFQNLYLFLSNELLRLDNYIYDYEFLSFFGPFDSSEGSEPDNCIIDWLIADWLIASLPIPNYINDIYWWYLADDNGFACHTELVAWIIKEPQS